MAQSILGYLKTHLSIGSGNGDFVAEYRKLTAEDKADLARYAKDEAAVLGIELAEKSAA